jgi:hypothetical protein
MKLKSSVAWRQCVGQNGSNYFTMSPPLTCLRLLLWIVLPAVAALVPLFAQAQSKRVALVVGNSSYSSISPLQGTRLDATTIADVLEKVHGFTVTRRADLSRTSMLRELNLFARAARDAETAVIYYSGHGVSSASRQNFLLPVDIPDMSTVDDVDTELSIAAISVDDVVDTIARTRARVQLLVLDACRDIPNGLPRSKSLPKGMAPAARVESRNLLIAFATESGHTARDGGRNRPSPYAEALAVELGSKGASTGLLTLLDNVAVRVERATSGAQRPTRYGNLRTDVCLVGSCSLTFAANALPKPAIPPRTAPSEVGTSRMADEQSSTSAVARDGRFVVQVGSFADSTEAAEIRRRVEKLGLKTYTHVAETADGKRIRVRVGPFVSRTQADDAAGKIKGLDLPANILTL